MHKIHIGRPDIVKIAIQSVTFKEVRSIHR